MLTTSGRAEIAYDVVGPTAGATHAGGTADDTNASDRAAEDILLIHAGVNDRRGWHHVVDRLSIAHRCVSYDQRGFGETVYESEPGWSSVADAVAVLDAAGTDRAVVIAGSMGGRVALDLALAHPERVAALLLIGTAVSGAPRFTLPPGPAADLADATDDEDLAAVERVEAWIWLDGPREPEGRVRGPARDHFNAMNAKALRAEDPGDEADGPTAWDRLADITVPTRVLIGDLDLPDFRTFSAHVAANIPSATLHRLPGVAHVPHLEGDPLTLDLIDEFVRIVASG